MKRTLVFCAAILVAAITSATFVCTLPYSDSYGVWLLVMKCPAAASANLPSGNHVGRTGPCFQKCLAYDGRNGASGSLAFSNPFHYGDQPYYCGTANKDPFSGKTIGWTGTRFVNLP